MPTFLWEHGGVHFRRGHMEKQQYRLNAILADPDITTRMRLRQATTAVPQFAEVIQAATLNEAIYKLESESRFDVVFISYKFNLEETKTFIEGAKKTKQGELAAFVLVLRTRDQDKSTIATGVMMGIDGFLFEPYSVDSLVEMTNLARKVRDERSAAKEKMATSLLVKEIIDQLDLVAYLKSCGYAVSKSKDRLIELCASLKGMHAENAEERTEYIASLFIDAPLPKKAFEAKKYGGVSARVRQRMEKKVMGKIGQLNAGG
jgi:DNA-binding NarL/FixJ family response regulator